ncbi:MAG TPA: SgcJ/EcaC family oxidoreductase [Thermoanaerobaculia bacterium]|nr:SgcJ/EcaC family oxidoreductase [Thermoanaerobaculia bacterium]
MAAEEPGSAGETEIRALIDRVVHAIRARDVDGVMSAFAPDVVSFDIGPPLQHGGGPAFAARWRELFDAYRGPIEYEVHDLDVTADDAVAFSHSLNRIAGTLENGRTSERWLRWTACYRRVEGRWRIVHEQVSVPVDPRDGKALLDLKP